MNRLGEKRQRKDKKRDIKPTIQYSLKSSIYRISYITDTPVKTIGEELTIAALRDKKVIDRLSIFFQRDFLYGNTLFRGHGESQHIGHRSEGKNERITIRFTQEIYRMITDLAFALDCSKARVVAILLEAIVKDMQVLNSYIKGYLGEHLTEKQMLELRNILRNINSSQWVQLAEDQKTKQVEYYSWASLLSFIVDDVNMPIYRVKEMVSEFLKKHKKH